MTADGANGQNSTGARTVPPMRSSKVSVPDPGKPFLVTILFVDIVNSTSQIMDLSLDAARDAVDEALAPVKLRIRQFDGTVARVQGDGIMAIFGAPGAREDHALLACCAAQAICEDFRALAAAGPGLRELRIGLHSGQVLTRIQENDFGSDYDALGPDVNVAKKIEEASSANVALLSRETLDLAGPAVIAKKAQDLAVGAGRTMHLFELQAIAFDHNVGHVIARRHISPFVGRQRVLEQLTTDLEAVRAGSGSSIAVVGEAGIGKSRLLFELSKVARASNVRVLELRGNSVLSRTPFAPVKSLFLDLLQLAAEPSRTESIAALDSCDLPAAQRDAALDMIGLSHASEEWGTLDAGLRRRAMFEAARALLRRSASREPCLLLAEDIQFLDSETIDLLAVLRSLCATHRVLVVATARNSARAVAIGLADRVIDLTALSSVEAQDLCRSLVGGSAIGHEDIETVIHRTSGNPLFLEELVRDLRQAGGSKRVATPLNVASLVQARLGSVSEAASHLIKATSVLGEIVDRRTLAHTAGFEMAALPPLLAELDRLDLIDDSDPTVVTFRHEVFRSAVDGALLNSQRVELHRRAVVALESVLHATPELLERLAHHSEMAGDTDAALRYILRASHIAVRSFSLKTVRALYDWAMRLSPKAPASSMPVLLDIVAESFDALQQSGDVDEYRKALDFAVMHAGTEGNRETEGLARAHLALLDWMQARYTQGRQHSEIALAIARDLGSLRLRALAQPHLANIEHASGNLDRAIELHMDIVRALEGEHEHSTFGRMILSSVRSRSFAAWMMSERGRFDDAQVQIEKAEAALKAFDQPYSRVLLNAARGILALWRDRPADGLPALEWAREFCLAQNYLVMEPCVSGWLASALVRSGDPERAREIAKQSIDAKRYLRGGRYTWVYIHQGLAEAHFACNEIGQALAMIERAVEIAQEGREPIHIAEARFARGRMLMANGNAGPGTEDVKAALALAERHHLDPLAANCRAILGQP